MTDYQRIHPVVDVEAPGATPFGPRGSAKSEKGSPSQQHPPRAIVPTQHMFPPTKRSCCCKFICWTISLLIILIISIAATAGILYLVFKPQVPKYSVDSLRISDLRLNYDHSLYAKFDVTITANNPNKKIGIYYEQGGHLSVWYTNTELCSGSLPKFYQGHQNITKLDVALTGQSQYGSTILSALQQQQQTGRIPLELKINAPQKILEKVLLSPRSNIFSHQLKHKVYAQW